MIAGLSVMHLLLAYQDALLQTQSAQDSLLFAQNGHCLWLRVLYSYGYASLRMIWRNTTYVRGYKFCE